MTVISLSDAVPVEDENAEPPEESGLVESDLLVEEISIDGMCGVY